MKKVVRQLVQNPDTNRLEFDGDGLHCGMCLEVLVVRNGKPCWEETRLEYGQDWFLVGLPGIQVNGLFARMTVY